MKSSTNHAASVRQRLLDRAKREGRPFSELAQYYVMERFLSRLSLSPHSVRFVLKGAMLLKAWGAPGCRPTMDVDLLGITSNDATAIAEQVAEICSVDVDPDGLEFLPETIVTETITEEAAYDGLRVRFHALLGKMVLYMQLDLGFGDVVYPAALEIRIPTLLDLPSPCLLGYSRESVIAEKLHAMARHGDLNSRMKDFYDIWHLSRNYEFIGTELAKAAQMTFLQRGMDVPAELESFREEFSTMKQPLWAAFRKRNPGLPAPEKFWDLISDLTPFVLPVLRRTFEDPSQVMRWSPPGPWQEKSTSGGFA
ncbi:nucleotidyl transferase AbiEii/AbiGii toxin family protein [Myxococcota bacterium]|nr:nucleotidyl transferase AbiEii/AbiGii toxin family protein [Myxococcota bacterium]